MGQSLLLERVGEGGAKNHPTSRRAKKSDATQKEGEMNDEEQMSCPGCGKPLCVDLKGVTITALCCGKELDSDAETLIQLLEETE